MRLRTAGAVVLIVGVVLLGIPAAPLADGGTAKPVPKPRPPITITPIRPVPAPVRPVTPTPQPVVPRPYQPYYPPGYVGAPPPGALSNQDRALIERMRQWIAKNGRTPTDADLQSNPAEFRRAWELYRQSTGGVVTPGTGRPRDAEFRTYEKMRLWIKNNSREPTAEDLGKDAAMKPALDTYRKLKDYFTKHAGEEDQMRARFADAAKRSYQAGLQAFEQKNYPGAIKNFNDVVDTDYAPADSLADIKAKLDEINTLGQAELDKAKQLADDKKYKEASAAYAAAATTFHGVDAGTAAEAAAAELKKDPEVAKAIHQQLAIDRLAAADAAAQAKKYLDALLIYDDLAKNYSDVVPQGKQGADKAAAIRADTALMAEVDAARSASEIKNLISQAESYEKNGQYDRAVQKLQELVAKYPKSAEAKRASERAKVLAASR